MSNQPVYSHLSSKEDDEILLAKEKDGTMKKDLIERPEINKVPNTYVGQMIAPATLPEGYELPVHVGSSKFKIQIPMGGVEEGQVFTVAIPQDGMDIKLPSSKTSAASVPPVGAWRDNMYDCFKHGFGHSHCVTSFFCPLLATGQVMNRLQLNWKCVPATNGLASSRAFAIIFYVTILMWTMFAITEVLVVILYPKENLFIVPIPKPDGVLLTVTHTYNDLYHIFVLITSIFIFMLRRAVRKQYKIPGTCCEDFCCTVWGRCCVLSQMLRHTTDYDVNPGRVCSPTGLSPRANPLIV